MDAPSPSLSIHGPTGGGSYTLDRLRCPICESTLRMEGGSGLRCEGGGHPFELRAGVPVLLARPQHTAGNGAPEQESYAPEEASSIRVTLRRFARRPAVMRLRELYRRIDALVAPRSPLSLLTWMERVHPLLPPSPRRVLDLGGGSGANREVFCAAEDDYTILEVDPDVRFVRENFFRHRYVIADAHSPALAPNQFDAILMIEVLEHMRDPFHIFDNCAKWLRPGGVLVVKVPQYWHVHG